MTEVNVYMEISSEGMIGGIEIREPGKERPRVLGERMKPQIIEDLEEGLLESQLRVLYPHEYIHRRVQDLETVQICKKRKEILSMET